MSDQNSIPDPVQSKPTRPYPDFPLGPHPAGYWCKRIRGTLHYFGPHWTTKDHAGAAAADAALEDYEKQKDALHAGRKPKEETGELTVKALVNRFLSTKKSRVEQGVLSPRTWEDYKRATDEVIAAFGGGRLVSDLAPDDFAELRNRMAKKWGQHRLGTTIQCVRCLFRFADQSALIDRPVRFGPEFDRPSAKTMRKHRAESGAKLFTADEIERLLDAAGVQMQAMILLGINCGFGNSDCGNLPMFALDLDTGWIDFPRPKTGIARRCPLWPETVEAIRAVLAARPEPKDPENAGLVFITKYHDSWAKDTSDNPISKEMAKLLKELHINGRKGLGFYTLRHTFRTIADEARDQPAADYIMGHKGSHMSTVYREKIADERLCAVVMHVREWLLGEAAK